MLSAATETCTRCIGRGCISGIWCVPCLGSGQREAEPLRPARPLLEAAQERVRDRLRPYLTRLGRTGAAAEAEAIARGLTLDVPAVAPALRRLGLEPGQVEEGALVVVRAVEEQARVHGLWSSHREDARSKTKRALEAWAESARRLM